jgi:hypothetical protein
LLVSGTLSDARLSSNVALENVANIFSAKQSFSGTDHVGLCLQSLTTAQYNALTAANGDLFRDSTTDRIDARLARGTVEVIDSAGGQVVAGNLAATTLMVGGASGPLLRNNGGTIEARNNANSANAPLGCSNLFASSSIQSTSEISARGGSSSIALYNGANRTGVWIDGGTVPRLLMTSGSFFGLASSTTDATTTDVTLSRASAGVWQMGTTSNNALGSLNLTNLTASGTVTASGTGTHTFGTTNTVTMAAGLLTASSSFTLFQSSSSNRLAIINASGVVVKNNSYIGWGSSSVDGGGTPVCYFDQSAGTISARTGAGALTPFGCSNLTASGTLQVGGGTVVASILSATATLDFPSISGNDTHTLTITVTGAVAGDSVFLGVPATLDAGLIFCASVTAADTVTVRLHNSSGSPVDPASGTFRATVIRF